MNSEIRKARPFLIILFLSLMPMLSAQRIGTTPIFLESEQDLAESNVHFSQAVSFGNMLYVFYQRITLNEGRRSQAVVYRTSRDGLEWSEEETLISGIVLESALVPPVFSLAHNSRELAVAISLSDDMSEIFTYDQNRWRRESINGNGSELIIPELFATSRGIMLFASRRTRRTISGNVQTFRSIVYAFRPTGGTFSTPRLLPVPQEQIQIFNPYLIEHNNRFYLVYENRSFSLEFGISGFIYAMHSSDLGRTWTTPVLATDFVDLEDRNKADVSVENYVNQNPRLFRGRDNRLLLLTDRSRQGQNSRVSLSYLDEDGRTERFQSRDNQYISSGNRSSSSSDFFVYKGREYILYYFDTAGTSQVYLAFRDPINWSVRRLSSGSGVDFLPQVVNHRDNLHFFWLQRNSPGSLTNTLVYRPPDQFVAAPDIIPLNYIAGKAINTEEVIYGLRFADDFSGVSSIRYAWTQEDTVSDSDFTTIGRTNQIQFLASELGPWNLFVQAIDRAGNRSEYAHISTTIDLSAPGIIRFGEIPRDENGYLLSNTVEIGWFENSEADLGGYRVQLQYLGGPDTEISSIEAQLAALRTRPVAAPLQTEPLFRLTNADNGLWALVANAVDLVGNEGSINVELIRLNKFIPITSLNIVNLEENILGNYELSFTGRGYSANGIINSIVFDLDGQAPWDHELLLSNGDYEITSDRIISNINLAELATGEYLIGLNHTGRGRYIHPERLSFELNGAVKLGDYSLYRPEQVVGAFGFRMIQVWDIVVFVAVFLLIVIILVSLTRIRSILKDSRELEAEVEALVEGRMSPSARQLVEERIIAMKKQGFGLRTKFAIFMLILVIAVVALVSIPLSTFILSNQRQILAQGLQDRIEVMIESLTTGAASELNSNNVINIIRGLGQLSNQVTAMEEIEYITITSRGNPNNPDLDQEEREYIWSSNDLLLFATEPERESYAEDISEDNLLLEYFQRRSTKPEEVIFNPGTYIIQDEVSELISNEIIPNFNANIDDPAIQQLTNNLNRIIEQRVGGDLQESLSQENELRSRLTDELDRYIILSSEPAFSVENYNIRSQYYTFFNPIYWFDDDFTANYQGTIRLGISTEIINQQIRDTQQRIIVQVLIFTSLAIAAGVVGAILLSSITINPIKKLVSGVERIRDTEVKSELSGQPIDIHTGDELNFLSDTINQMTEGLIKAEVANKSLMLGKDVQKMFISLDPSPFDANTKDTTCHQETEFVEFFGYYEGAKGVSGDYFFYEKIDDNTYALIKCDVSGKDIEAALIMVTVATLFLQYFDDWRGKQIRQQHIARLMKQADSYTVLSDLAANINEIIYAREFKGKFAAFNLLTLDEKTGKIIFCNAGDNIVHIYKRKERKMIDVELASTPAAGAISEHVIGSPINFPEEYYQLESGDILFLFTDGFEEARRYLRYDDWSIYPGNAFEAEGGAERLAELEKEMAPYILGQDEGGFGESFSVNRIRDVIESVMGRKVYELTKFRNPSDAEQFTFDFSSIEPTLPNTMLALLSVEKVFRLTPLPHLTVEHRISIDKKVDDFLKKYFLQYSNYFHHPLAENEQSLYRRYSYMAEDSQYDDLTILAVQKK